MKNILAFAASNSSKSINKQLVSYAASQLKENHLNDAEIEVIDLNDYEMPLYSSDREDASGIPPMAHEFFQKIGKADGLVISFAEHNGSYTAAYKNIFDWASRIDSKVYQDKPMVIFSTSPGPGGASSVLASAKTSAPFFAAEVKSTLSVPSFYDNFDMQLGKISNPEINTQLETALASLV